MSPSRGAALRLEALDLGLLALFVGQRMNDVVLERIHAAGFPELRTSHGYLFQHFVDGPRSITELAERLGVTQQAASKAVAELAALGYLEDAESADARRRCVRLSARGERALRRSREIRREVAAALARGSRPGDLERARRVLTRWLSRLGGLDAVRSRRVPDPATGPARPRSRVPTRTRL